MSLGSGLIPAVTCPNCSHIYWIGKGCPKCGMNYGLAQCIAKGIGPHPFETDDIGYDSCLTCGKIEDFELHREQS